MRWTIRRVHVLPGRGGYTLAVTDTGWSALAISVVYGRLMKVLGHPCCGRCLGTPDLVPNLAWDLLQSTAGIEWDHTTRLVELPVNQEVAGHCASATGTSGSRSSPTTTRRTTPRRATTTRRSSDPPKARSAHVGMPDPGAEEPVACIIRDRVAPETPGHGGCSHRCCQCRP
jgi:hypothetical protein